MSRLTSEQRELWSRSPGNAWEGRSDLTERSGYGGRSSDWLLAALIIGGLGALAWYYLGPDLRRYLKIRSM
jgi:hypothetical protein